MARRTRRIKIGIDVGGTFTHAVALDADTLSLIGKEMVPTTHTASEGVARGVVDSLHRLLHSAAIKPKEVALIAHSTTQATNALLEGDVARVGIIGMAKGIEGWRARGQTNVSDIELAPGKFLSTRHRFIDTSEAINEAVIQKNLDELIAEGAEVFVASEAFGVDNPGNEQRVVEYIRGKGFLATAASEISQLYGLRVRTRTAVINASMLVKMLQTAEMTEKAVRESGITSPLMIMRSDGGIMDLNEMRRRPILTMLSGPAAGVAAALMFVKISDGLFLEVGGTSTDISIIRNGRPMIRSAEVGGHRLYMKTLDIRTVGIGGGSMPRLRGSAIIDVGPRSAHIAGLKYIGFANPASLRTLSLHLIAPRLGDPKDYMSIASDGSAKPEYSFTTTEAANSLGLIKQYGKAISESLTLWSAWLTAEFGKSIEEISKAILDLASDKVISILKKFIEEYKLHKEHITLVGGGGGAEVIVPYTAQRLGVQYSIAEHTEVISAIGVALGMIRDTIERSVLSPTDADIVNIRQEAIQSVLQMGAAAESIEVRIEVDKKRKRLSATASGAPELRTGKFESTPRSADELKIIVAGTCPEGSEIRCISETEFLKAFEGRITKKRFFGLIKEERVSVRIIDHEGVMRLKLNRGVIYPSTSNTLPSLLNHLIDEYTIYGDAGGLNPDIFILSGGRIIDLSGLANKDQILALLRVETEMHSGDEQAVAIIAPKE
ncbi:MAG: hydantoinase/oxoprolinase family protein [bacterium]